MPNINYDCHVYVHTYDIYELAQSALNTTELGFVINVLIIILNLGRRSTVLINLGEIEPDLYESKNAFIYKR